MQDETIPTETSGQTGTSSAPLRGSSFRPLVGESEAAWLESIGLVSASPLQEAGLIAIRPGKDATVVQTEATKGIDAYIVSLLLEKRSPSGRGSTIIVAANQDVLREVQEGLAKHELQVTLPQSAEEGSSIVVGTAGDLKAFFEGEISRAMSIGRVILHGVDAEIEATREVLAAACKRGRRPQLVLIAEEITPAIQDLTRGLFQVSVVKLQHLFHEVTGELLSKPEALADYLEANDLPSTLIFCNQASETDLVEVMLKKRGISNRKLLQHLNPTKVAQTVAQVTSGEVAALIVTDIAARHLEVEDFELIINYSIPSDPEVYVHRTETSGGGGKLKKVLSLVGPLDRANFHYLKKIVEAEFEKAPPIAKGLGTGARLKSLKASAQKKNHLEDAGIQELVKMIVEDADRDSLIAYLVYAATTAPAPAQNGKPEREHHGREDRVREDRDRKRGDKERGDRRRGKEQSVEAEDEGREEAPREPQRRRERPAPTPIPPQKKTCRLYVGKGKAEGLEESHLTETVKGAFGEDQVIKRASIRPHYTFLDVTEDHVEKVIELLEQSDQKLFVKKAITLSAPREREHEEGENYDAPAESREEGEVEAE